MYSSPSIGTPPPSGTRCEWRVVLSGNTKAIQLAERAAKSLGIGRHWVQRFKQMISVSLLYWLLLTGGIPSLPFQYRFSDHSWQKVS